MEKPTITKKAITKYLKVKADPSGVQKSLTQELMGLAKRVLIIVAVSWVALYLFDVILAASLGIGDTLVQITSTIVIIGLSIIIITTARRLAKRISPRIGLQIAAIVTFSIVVTVLLFSTLAIMIVWQIDIQAVLIGGGVAAIIIGFVVSTLAGNIFAGGLVLTTFPAKVGDSIFVVNDNIHGTVGEVTFMYTRVISDAGTEYIVPNTAIVQGSVRIIKETRVIDSLPFAKDEHVSVLDGNQEYKGVVTRITPRFTFLSADDNKSEIVLPNASILSGKYLITKHRH